jgi:DNA-binding XRE family transcriptional regulator
MLCEKEGIEMSFRDNLQHLRATRNMTQEQLAMMVGVSRQSVTKWEAERAYPEMDKLLKICQIFDCSLDELVQGDLTTREAEPGKNVPADAGGLSYTFVDLAPWLTLLNDALNPFDAAIEPENLDVVYLENGAFRSTSGFIRDDRYLYR